MYRRPLSELKYIIIHHSVTPENFSVDDIRRIHEGEGYCDVGYHYLIAKVKGKRMLKAGRPIIYVGAHALGEKLSPSIIMNRVGIGICIIGSYENAPPDNETINEVSYAIKLLAKRYKIPLDRKHVLGHREVDYTACPGKFTMKKIYDKLEI